MKHKRHLVHLFALLCVGLIARRSRAEEIPPGTLQLYVDEKTKVVYTEPGPDRVKLGDYQAVDDDSAAPVQPNAEAGAPDATPPAGSPEAKPEEKSEPAPVPETNKEKEKKWYDRFSIRGYVQFRYTMLFDHDGAADWFHPADRSVGPNETFLIRRARLILSGDATDHLFIYIQPDMNAAPSTGDFSVQLRDAYADVAIDKKKEFRFRLGQSKVPYGFVNLQSSQNRAPMERPDGINSAAEGERDIGVSFMWAPAEIRERFKMLVKDGLKGSGDYGVVAFGIYSGQGPNRLDTNIKVHTVARVSYPIKLKGGQIIEPGIQGSIGRFLPRTGVVDISGTDVTPVFANPDGVRDDRGAISFVLYPQPFGLEAEWNVGHGPELNSARTAITQEFLHGGYVQALYRIKTPHVGTVFPFVRWQYFDGGRKFATNSPEVETNELDTGIEWQALPELELTTMYSFAYRRTESNVDPYQTLRSGHRLGFQAQWNY